MYGSIRNGCCSITARYSVCASFHFFCVHKNAAWAKRPSIGSIWEMAWTCSLALLLSPPTIRSLGQVLHQIAPGFDTARCQADSGLKGLFHFSCKEETATFLSLRAINSPEPS